MYILGHFISSLILNISLNISLLAHNEIIELSASRLIQSGELYCFFKMPFSHL